MTMHQKSIPSGLCRIFNLLPEQLGVNKGDDVLQDLECRANEEVGAKASDDCTEERRPV